MGILISSFEWHAVDMYSGDITGIAWAPRKIPNGKEISANPVNELSITDLQSLLETTNDLNLCSLH